MFSFDVVPGRSSRILDTSVDQVVNVVEDAYLRHDAGLTSIRTAISWFPDKPEARIIALPASIELADARPSDQVDLQLPRQRGQRHPARLAVLVLNDHATGYPKALLEAGQISAVRTAASAAVRPGPSPGTCHRMARLVHRRRASSPEPSCDTWSPRAIRSRPCRSSTCTRTRRGTWPIRGREPGASRGCRHSLSEAMAAQTVIATTTAAAPYIEQRLRPARWR